MTRELSAPLLSELESDVCIEMQSRLALKSDRDLVRLALWHLAQHADLDIPAECFALLDSPAMPDQRPEVESGVALPLFSEEETA